MKVYDVARARAHLSELLDAAERGEPVFIERRGIRHAIAVAESAAPWPQSRPRLEIVDAALEDGEWSWTWREQGLRFSGRRPRRK